MTDRTIPEILADLVAATGRLELATREEAEARRKATDARNFVNMCQKEMEVALTALRKSAPRDTDWARNAEQKRSAE